MWRSNGFVSEEENASGELLGWLIALGLALALILLGYAAGAWR